jgi:branched-chain amino acid transport system permease protein
VTDRRHIPEPADQSGVATAATRATAPPPTPPDGRGAGATAVARPGRLAPLRGLFAHPVAAPLLVIAVLGLSAYGVAHYPRSIVVFMLFQVSILLLYLARMAGWLKALLAAVTLGVVMPVLGSINGYYLEIAIQVCIFVALALGLNIVVGLAGLLDLGYVAFFAVGAYTWAIFGSPQANQIFGGTVFPLSPIWFFVFLVLGVLVAAAAGILLGLPVLRLHGDYLAIVTLGFGEVIRVLANNLDKPINITNGPKGITPISRPPIFFEGQLRGLGIDPNPNVIYPLYLYFLVLLIVGVTVLVNRRLENSHIGRAWEAIREDQTAAQAMGVPLVRMKLLAFACGASFAGAVGVVFAAKQVFINPESFTFMESIGVLAMVILGGMGSIPGAILGATVVTVLNLQVLKGLSLWLNELRNAGVEILGFNLANLPSQLEPAKYERMVFGLILVLMMIFRPQGILPARRRHRELAHETEG